MQKMLVGTVRMQRGTVGYYLLTYPRKNKAISYGLFVEYADEQIFVLNLSPSKELVEKLLEEMLRGSVTPVSVPDIVEDWLLA